MPREKIVGACHSSRNEYGHAVDGDYTRPFGLFGKEVSLWKHVPFHQLAIQHAPVGSDVPPSQKTGACFSRGTKNLTMST